MDTNSLATALYANINALVTAARTAESLPKTEADVAALLDALAAAEMAVKAHVTKFTHEADKAYEDKSEEYRTSWSACFEAREKAVAALTKFAVARFEAANTAKAA